MALVVAHMCRDSAMTPPLTGIYAPMPGGVSNVTVPAKYADRFVSIVQNSQAPMLWSESIDFFRSKATGHANVVTRLGLHELTRDLGRAVRGRSDEPPGLSHRL